MKALVGAVGVLSALPAAAVNFSRVVVDPDFHGDCKAVGDIDGDGAVDIVVGRSTLAWYRWPDWKRTEIARAANEFTTDMQVVDLDGDGDQDIVVPDGDKGDNVSWFENTGRGAGWKRHTIGAHGNFGHDLEVADLDRDGRLDVVVREGRTHVFFQGATPRQWQKVAIDTVGRGGTALADLSGDGRPDIVQNGYWLETPTTRTGKFQRHDIAGGWDGDVGVTVGDVTGDKRLDVLIAPAEAQGALTLYEAPADPRRGAWKAKVIDPEVGFVHTFKLGDLDRDGRLDVVFAEMSQSPRKRTGVYWNRGERWELQVLGTGGAHNIRVADFGNDGALDIVAADWDKPPLVLWRNTRERWTYVEVDRAREKPYFGLTFPRLGRGRAIASGPYVYLPPAAGVTSRWTRVRLPGEVDAMWSVDLDGDGQDELLAQALPELHWLRPEAGGQRWFSTVVGRGFARTEHGNGQGYALAQIVPGGYPEPIFSTGKGIHYVVIPARPGNAPWQPVKISGDDTSEEGVAVGDFDRDGQLDVAAAYGKAGDQIGWWKNPGNGRGDWRRQRIGAVSGWADRFGVADFNRDGRLDVVVSVENGKEEGAATVWFEQPPSGGDWRPHTVAVQGTTNSLDVGDVDGDGDVDLVTGEHRGRKKIVMWLNDGKGAFRATPVDEGKESHLGTRLVDLDGDGDLDLASIAWDAFGFLHVWRNDTR